MRPREFLVRNKTNGILPEQTGVEPNNARAVVDLVAASAIATEYFSPSDIEAECFNAAGTKNKSKLQTHSFLQFN